MASLAEQSGALVAHSKTLLNAELKRICKDEGKVQSGNKAQLQARVIALIDEAVRDGNADAFNRLRHRIHNRGEPPPASNAMTGPPVVPNNAALGNATSYTALPQRPPNVYNGWQQQSYGCGSLMIFKPSPFYDISDLLLKDIVLEALPGSRNTIQRTLSLPLELGLRMKQDPSLRLLLFGCVDQPLAAYSLHDVAFPAQFEVRINEDEVKSNYKGLKNKPGSTRPADLTNYVRKTPATYRNTLKFTYALTQKRYTLYVYLVKKHSVQELSKRITQHNVITKQSVLDEMKRKANDPDIEVGSINMGLKDPVSTLRIQIPCRSTLCSHLQCFDAESFLQLQEQAPTWLCPICNKTVSFEALAVDEYVQEILQNVPKTTDQVKIDPMGKWSFGDDASMPTPKQSGSTPSHNISQYDSDDDLIDVTNDRVTTIKTEAGNTPVSMSQTPPLSSREASSAPRTGSKRKSEVIDLTLSDDDEEPVRPTKKVSYTSTPSSLPNVPQRYPPPSYGGAPSIPLHRTLPSPRPPPPPPVSFHLPRIHPPQYLASPSPQSYQHNVPFASPPRPPQPPQPPQTPPLRRPSYTGNGTAAYPAYLGSSP
ncbi:hypothetical protein M011DRAFT_474867 [Sporormia fimetaria CBS 119925]|uniref:E3 SUMO-protein ligase PIAS1 n=1 Tax=Sporormia fimetaria CBS 119925 TaxID=1340428 RepID=A0A6A6VL24_9PLEO|nr:hypothetical protein M011DRAFT_474867 [Sporormia fimetaria CBS 119925]